MKTLPRFHLTCTEYLSRPVPVGSNTDHGCAVRLIYYPLGGSVFSLGNEDDNVTVTSNNTSTAGSPLHTLLTANVLWSPCSGQPPSTLSRAREQVSLLASFLFYFLQFVATLHYSCLLPSELGICLA